MAVMKNNILKQKEKQKKKQFIMGTCRAKVRPVMLQVASQ